MLAIDFIFSGVEEISVFEVWGRVHDLKIAFGGILTMDVNLNHITVLWLVSDKIIINVNFFVFIVTSFSPTSS